MSGELRVHIPPDSDFTFTVNEDGLTRVAPDMLALLFAIAYGGAGTVEIERNY